MERLQIPPTVSPIPGIEPFIQMFSKNTHAEDVTKHDTFRAGRGGRRGGERGGGKDGSHGGNVTHPYLLEPVIFPG